MIDIVAWILVLTLGILAFLPIVWECKRGNPDTFSPIFWISPLLFVLYGLVGAMRLWSDEFIVGPTYHSDADPIFFAVEVLVYANIGLACLIVGYYVSAPATTSVSSLPQFRAQWSASRAWIVVIICMIIGLAGYWSLVPHLGEGLRSELVKGSSTIGFIAANLLNTASIILLANVFISDISPSDDGQLGITVHSLPSAVASIVIVTANIALVSTLGGRERAVLPLIVGLFFVHYLFRPFSVVEWAPIYGAITVVPAWIAALLFSLISLDFSQFVSEFRNPYPFYDWQSYHFDNMLALVAGMPDPLDYQYGETFLGGIVSPLPIQPWAETYTVYNRVFMDGMTGSGVKITLIGELYMNFWVIGIVVGMGIVGVLVRLLYEWAVVSPGATRASIVVFAAFPSKYLLNGNFSTEFPNLGLIMLPLLIALLFVTGGMTFKRQATDTSSIREL